jgi:hypothetical protein
MRFALYFVIVFTQTPGYTSAIPALDISVGFKARNEIPYVSVSFGIRASTAMMPGKICNSHKRGVLSSLADGIVNTSLREAPELTRAACRRIPQGRQRSTPRRRFEEHSQEDDWHHISNRYQVTPSSPIRTNRSTTPLSRASLDQRWS